MEHENMTATPTPSPKATPTASNADLEQLPVEQVLASLTVEPDQGLSQAEAQKRLSQYGPNAIIEKEQSLFAKIAGYFMGPIAYVTRRPQSSPPSWGAGTTSAPSPVS